MTKKLTPEVLARYLDEVRSGRLSLDQCLEARPAEADELRPLLETALALSTLPSARPDPAFRARGRAALMGAMSAEKELVTKARLRRFWTAIAGGWQSPPGPTTRRKPVPALVVTVVLMVTASLGGGATYASQGALPGDVLYQVKTALEGFQEAFATSEESKALVNVECAQKRLDETQRAIRDGRADAAQSAAGGYAGCLAKAEEHLSEAAASGKDVTSLASTLSDVLARQQATLAAVKERAPEVARPAVSKAAEKAEKGLSTAMALSESARASSQGRAPGATAPLTGTVPLGRPADKPGRDRDGEGGKLSATATPTISGTLGAPLTPTVTISGTLGVPLTPTVTISGTIGLTLTQTISDVLNLAKDPEVPGKSFEGLLAKLDAAAAALGRGQANVAVHSLDAFLNELNAMRRSGHISPENYERLYDQYSSLVARLGGTPGAQVPPRPETKPEKPNPEGSSRPRATPSPHPTPTIAPSPVVTPTTSGADPDDSRERPRGRPDDTPRRPGPDTAPTRVPPAGTPAPEPEREKPDQDTSRRPSPDAVPRQGPPAAEPPTERPAPDRPAPRGQPAERGDNGPRHSPPAGAPAPPSGAGPAQTGLPSAGPNPPDARQDRPPAERGRGPTTP